MFENIQNIQLLPVSINKCWNQSTVLNPKKSHFDMMDPVAVVGSGQPHFQATGITSKGHCSANIHKDQTYRLNMKRQHNVDM